ncbi:glutamate ABC transporter substrate-binding protein [Corynebacterium sp. CCUG 65737]|uniref:glutamate ABC transporter substrate-binding protein n=1 Tax=Corynebacterium sp. CCUG 65737 TaxID=2823889 RepID=UPI00210B7C14|nr:glutamate ABC transporter substrate-binding protein [Corynebacterium sp. CCUG 65737]MCQ4619275.1 glutamate ABC transporter substrate-binding protein [Corynebacterium pseudogenitalium]MCQ4627368.1 glutamate ABC transporter substrate-binding protein [Corynebacterium sp. CCUG 65737]
MGARKVFSVSVLAALGALTACTPAPPPPPPLPEPDAVHDDVPLPPGADLDIPGLEPESATATFEWEGSLRPDDQQPEERVPDIVKRGRLIVGVDQSQYLLSFRDNATGELRGFEVDLAREIARDIFGDPDKVDFRFVESTMRTEALQSGQVDVVIRTMSITRERAEKVDFSVPYLDSSVRMLVPAASGIESVEDVGDERVCVADGSNVVDMARSTFPEQEVLRTRTWTDCLMAMQQFQAGFILGDETILAGAAAQDPLTTVTGEAVAEQQYAIGIPKGYDGLTRQVNSTLERVRDDGTWNRIFDDWLGPHIASRSAPGLQYRPDEPTEPDAPADTEVEND